MTQETRACKCKKRTGQMRWKVIRNNSLNENISRLQGRLTAFFPPPSEKMDASAFIGAMCTETVFFFYEKYSSDTAVYRIIKKSYLRGYAEEAVKVLERGKRRKAILKLNPDFTASD